MVPEMNLPESMEPPLSPVGLGAGLRRAPEADAGSPPLTGPPPLPNRLLRMGLVTLPQLSAAMSEQAATGRPLTDILLESGLISADDLAKLDEPAAAPPPPVDAAPVYEPEPEVISHGVAFAEPALMAVPPPVAYLDPTPAPATGQPVRFAVVAELENGGKIEVCAYGDPDSAREAAAQVMRAIRHATDDWPLLGGRYVRPQSVISIEVAALL
jgi:hypothetical protein